MEVRVENRFLLTNIDEPKTFLVKDRLLIHGKPLIQFNHFRSSQVRYQIDVYQKDKISIGSGYSTQNKVRFRAELKLTEEMITSKGKNTNILAQIPVYIDDSCANKTNSFFYLESIFKKSLKGLLRH